MAALVGTIQVRKDTAANWTTNNPTLLSGEQGLETDTRRVKIGDGATAWNALAYSLNPLGVAAATDILRRSDGDGRYDALGSAAAAQAAAIAASQPLDADLTAYANAADAAARRALIGAGTGNGNVNDGDTLTTGLTFPNTGLHLEDGPGDNTLTIVSNEDLTADRLLKIITNDATRTLTIAGDATISGTNTGDQTSVSGNAGTATALQTGRTIDGQTFDGTANITVIAPGTHAATGKTTPVDADELPLVDSAASNVLKKLTWANLKATAKTYFDTIYQALNANLTAIAGLTTAADKTIRFTGSGTAVLIDMHNPGSQTLAASVTFPGAGLAPATPTNTYNWTQIGNLVTYQFTLVYASAGTTVTSLIIALPSDMPNPFEQSGLTAASAQLYPAFGRAANGATATMVTNATSALRRNSGDTAYEFFTVLASGTYSHFFIIGSYFTA